MKWLIVIFSLFSLVALAESEFDRPDLQNISQSGKLVTLSIIPGAKTISFLVVGKPMVMLDLANAQLNVFILDKNNKKTLNLKKLSKGKFVSETINTQKPLEMEVQVKVGDETEQFNVTVP